jgi:L-rhamnose mutarotase
MQRIGLLLKVKADKIEEYKRIHADVWPELLAELRAAGMRNYSLWLLEDGTEFGYLECDDWDATCAYLADSEVHDRWQVFMQDYLESPTDASQGGQPVQLLTMSFLME